MQMTVEIIIAILVIVSALCFVATVIQFYRAPNALTRLNLTSSIAGVAIPLLIVANLLNTWLNGWEMGPPLIKSIVAITGYLVVMSVGSFVLGRAIHADHLRDRQPEDFDVDIPADVLARAQEGKPYERGWEKTSTTDESATASGDVADVKPVPKDPEEA